LLAVAAPLLAGAQTVEQNKGPFTATITNFQAYHFSYPVNNRGIAATIHFQNNTDKPLTLGYSPTGLSASDEQSNQYKFSAVHGMGRVDNDGVDPKFELPPKGGGDVLVELTWRGRSTDIFGVTYDLNMAVRGLKKMPNGKQFEIGAETSLQFTGLKSGFVSVPKGMPAPEESTVDAGPFTAKITRTKFGAAGRYRMIAEFNIKLTNTSDHPLILACEHDSPHGSDDQENFYSGVSGSASYSTVTGIGMVSPEKADPQFTLAPGESKEFHVVIGKADRMDRPTTFTFHLALEELEILPSNQIRELRNYSLTFPNLKV